MLAKARVAPETADKLGFENRCRELEETKVEFSEIDGVRLGYLHEQISAMANRPRLVLSGHVHRPKSWRGEIGRSTVLNPTFDEEGSFPNHVRIDFSSGLATWVSERRGKRPLKMLP